MLSDVPLAVFSTIRKPIRVDSAYLPLTPISIGGAFAVVTREVGFSAVSECKRVLI